MGTKRVTKIVSLIQREVAKSEGSINYLKRLELLKTSLEVQVHAIDDKIKSEIAE